LDSAEARERKNNRRSATI